MNQLVVVKNTLPQEIVAVSPEVMAEAMALVESAGKLVVTDAPQMEAANATYKAIDQLAKKVSEGRLEITRPIDALKKAIIAAEESAVLPLNTAKEELGKKIVACQKELQRIADEAARKAREEAEEKANIERERLEKELAKKKEEAEMFGEPEPDLPPPAPIPVAPLVPVIVDKIPGFAVPKAAARTTERKKLVIVDQKLIPLELGGVRLMVPDEKAIEKLLKAGVAVPGCKLESYSTIGAAGR